MSENTDDGEWLRAIQLVNVINKQPKVFAKWSVLKDQFSVLGLYDSPFKETTFTIEDAMKMINEADLNDDNEREPALLS